ncbi:ORF-141 [Agrotis segetum nucleopolyhedrovirus A]|uniref:ORF-141 n=1 Tax=Agrotis segetum nuclear polyhedrosis virus TaxID=1962501 RepID=Q287D1_NPVAS|nr:ORF-141 [Agrotis segetum nucleopolyhedrovirus A]AAZ38307.1 ORF-141 [Agrotis segetum nucleopolyhedrovirus A]
MPVFGKTTNSEAFKKSKDESLRKQLNQILQAKKQLSIQMQHWERIKRITKDPKEVADIEQKLYKMRMDFLKFSTDKF